MVNMNSPRSIATGNKNFIQRPVSLPRAYAQTPTAPARCKDGALRLLPDFFTTETQRSQRREEEWEKRKEKRMRG